MTSSFGRARTLRVVVFASGLLICALATDGRFAHMLGALVTIAALTLYWLETPRFFRLAWMWCGGFLLIVTPEGLTGSEDIIRVYGVEAYDLASRCLVAAHFAVLLGHDLVFAEHRVRPPADQLLLARGAAIRLLVVAWVPSVLYLVPLAVETYRTGRAGEELGPPSAIRAVMDGFVTSCSIVIPIAAAWLARRARGRARLALLALGGTLVALQFLLAVRFLLLFVLVGSVIAWTAPRQPGRRTVGIVLVLTVLLAFVSTVLVETRTYGMREADVGRAARSFSIDDFTMKEATVKSMTQAVVYSRKRGHTDGRTSAALLVFWVPRAFWPEKPTLIGYWLPREFERRGFSAGFSASPGFTGATYVDFGLWGTVLCWLFGGMMFGLLERKTARICAAEEDARILLVAPLYGATFFAVRSVDTAFLILVGVTLAVLAILVVGGRRRRHARVLG